VLWSSIAKLSQSIVLSLLLDELFMLTLQVEVEIKPLLSITFKPTELMPVFENLA
jgi:hypothetical protein